ncbi:biotin/lipoyl-binding protein, partial [Salmonella enterica]|nr:biotin/lipoyl-binding protein [Salmonella enterica]
GERYKTIAKETAGILKGEYGHTPAAFEPLPQAEAAQPVAKAEKPAASGIYTVEVEGKAFVVKVSDGGDISQLTTAVPAASSAPVQAAAPAGAGTPVTAPLAGNIWKVIATEGQTVAEGDVLLILEAMKMETEIRAAQAGTVRGIAVKSGDAVSVGDTLMTLA